MVNSSSDIQKLNQIVSIIDNKAAQYKKERYHMHRARADSEKKLIIDLINDGLGLAKSIGSQAQGLIEDLDRLKKQFIKL
ncbi:MAG: hypothetical protein JW864_14995 [Spirochaetes bacterium]|nr:hypothetical protein [Spirochaetota bacterium]